MTGAAQSIVMMMELPVIALYVSRHIVYLSNLVVIIIRDQMLPRSMM